MASDTQTRDAMGIARGATGTSTGDGTALVVTLGFRPKTVKLVNLTDNITWEKIDGMSDAQSMKKVAAGTTTVDTTSAIIIDDNGFTTSAALAASSKSLVWYVA